MVKLLTAYKENTDKVAAVELKQKLLADLEADRVATTPPASPASTVAKPRVAPVSITEEEKPAQDDKPKKPAQDDKPKPVIVEVNESPVGKAVSEMPAAQLAEEVSSSSASGGLAQSIVEGGSPSLKSSVAPRLKSLAPDSPPRTPKKQRLRIHQSASSPPMMPFEALDDWLS